MIAHFFGRHRRVVVEDHIGALAAQLYSLRGRASQRLFSRSKWARSTPTPRPPHRGWPLNCLLVPCWGHIGIPVNARSPHWFLFLWYAAGTPGTQLKVIAWARLTGWTPLAGLAAGLYGCWRLDPIWKELASSKPRRLRFGKPQTLLCPHETRCVLRPTSATSGYQTRRV